MPTGDGSKPGMRSPNWKGRDITYRSAHSRVSRLWGRASNYPCIRCGETAKDWAYDGSDPDEKVQVFPDGRRPMRFSPDPEFYTPMCRPCHGLIDAYPNGICSNGHEMTEDNIGVIRTRPGRRRCRECSRAALHRFREAIG